MLVVAFTAHISCIHKQKNASEAKHVREQQEPFEMDSKDSKAIIFLEHAAHGPFLGFGSV